MVFRAFPQHLRIAFWTTFFLARHAVPMKHGCVAFGANARPSTSHHVLTFLLAHPGYLLTDFSDESRLTKSKFHYMHDTLRKRKSNHLSSLIGALMMLEVAYYS